MSEYVNSFEVDDDAEEMYEAARAELNGTDEELHDSYQAAWDDDFEEKLAAWEARHMGPDIVQDLPSWLEDQARDEADAGEVAEL